MSVVTTVSSRGPPVGDGRARRGHRPFCDRLGKLVSVKPEERRTPEIVGREHVCGLQLHQELLVLIYGIECGGPARKSSRRGAVKPTNVWPQPARLDCLQETELEEDAGDAATRHNERRSRLGGLHGLDVPPREMRQRSRSPRPSGGCLYRTGARGISARRARIVAPSARSPICHTFVLYTPRGYNAADMDQGSSSLSRTAFQATAHCLTGCAIGEILGMVIATALGWGERSLESPWPLLLHSSSDTR